jgi:UDP-glucuronate 4-epimerase
VPAGIHRAPSIKLAEAAKVIKNLLPLQPGDVPVTYADVEDLERDMGFRPETPIEVGIAKFVEWYRAYYKI